MMYEELIVMEHMQIRMAKMEDLVESSVVESEMYEKACLHDEKGAWQMIFGVNTLPKYRRQGYAEKLLRYAINDARAQDREGLVLTCKDKLVHYYEKFGFQNEGVSESVHGGAMWYQMRLTF